MVTIGESVPSSEGLGVDLVMTDMFFVYTVVHLSSKEKPLFNC